jgi:hypothetical protein
MKSGRWADSGPRPLRPWAGSHPCPAGHKALLGCFGWPNPAAKSSGSSLLHSVVRPHAQRGHHVQCASRGAVTTDERVDDVSLCQRHEHVGVTEGLLGKEKGTSGSPASMSMVRWQSSAA